MENYITRPEHDEFCKRMEEENHRQNRRIELLEENVRQIGTLTTSVHELAHDMSQMLQEQKKQGERLDTQNDRLAELEQEPAKKAKKMNDRIVEKIIDTVVGAVAGAIATGLLIMAVQYIH